jgi:hypothetical protein
MKTALIKWLILIFGMLDAKYAITPFFILITIVLTPYLVQPADSSKFSDYGVIGRILVSEAGTTIYEVTVDEQKFTIKVTGEGIKSLAFGKEQKTTALENNGTAGVIEIEIPKELLNGEFTVMVDDNTIEFKKSETDTHTTLLLDRPDGTELITIQGTTVVPEFPIAMVILACVIAVVIASGRITHRFLIRHHG